MNIVENGTDMVPGQDTLAERGYDDLLEQACQVGQELGVPPELYDKTLVLLEELRQADTKTAHESLQALSYSLEVADVMTQFYDVSEVAERKQLVWMSALLHDIGKTKVRPELIDKSNAGQEWSEVDAEEMSQHAREGALILEAHGFPKTVCRVVAEHHSKQLSRREYGMDPKLNHEERFVRDCVAIADFADACLNRTNSRNRQMDRDQRLTLIRGNTEYVLNDYTDNQELAQAVNARLATVS